MTPARRGLLAALGFAALAVVQAPAAWTGRAVWATHDLLHHHLPWRAVVARAWARGQLPLWSPEVGAGFPLAADGQVAAYYPVNLLLGLLLPVWHLPTASALLHTGWAGLGGWVLARALGLGGAPAALLGVGWPLSGFMVAHLNYGGMQAVAAWIPWFFAALVAPGGRSVWVGLCVAALLTAGHVQLGAFALLGGAALVALRQAPPLRALGGLGLGLVPAAAQLVSSWELGGLSERAGGVDGGFAAQGSLPPPELVNAVLPRLWGWEPPAAIPLAYHHKGPGYFGLGESHWESCFYLGIPTLLLAAAARGKRAWAALAVGSAVLMLGRYTPAWALLRGVPGFDHFRFPVRFSAVLTVAALVLAAWGLHRLLEEDPQGALRRTLGRVAAVGAVAGLVGGAAGGLALRAAREPGLAWLGARVLGPGREPERLAAIWDGLGAGLWPGVLAAVAVLGGMAALVRSPLGDRGLGGALVVLLGVDLAWNLRGYNPLTPVDALTRPPAALAVLRQGGASRVAVVDRVQPVALNSALQSASLGSLWGVGDVLVPSPLHLAGYEALLAQAGLDLGPTPGPELVRRVQEQGALVSALSVDHLLTVHTLDSPQYALQAALPVGDAVVHVYRNLEVLPRARVHRCPPALPESCDRPPVPARLVRESPLEIEVQAEGPGVLVLADVVYPGWTAAVDGAPVPVQAAYGALRAVELPQGAHTVRFAYRPGWWPLVPLSALGWLGLAVGALARVWGGLRMKAA